uniref:Uncharacterized protein n=1 Tax=Nelumbo nucifera TaxID=4432 RepID=A0A822ZHK4_NELNU|nr:TPA_asm: hypothetical protein HUJ06_002230 [Nelumbo nucifera]
MGYPLTLCRVGFVLFQLLHRFLGSMEGGRRTTPLSLSNLEDGCCTDSSNLEDSYDGCPPSLRC